LWFGTVNLQSVHIASDINGNGYDELLVVDLKSGGQVQGLMRDTKTLGWLPSIWFSPSTFKSAMLIDDVNGNGSQELVVMDSHDGSRLQLLRRDIKSRGWIGAVWFKTTELAKVRVIADQSGNGSQEVLVVDKKADGRVQVLLRDLKTLGWYKALWFNTVNFQQVLLGGDSDGDGKEELLVVDAKPSGQLQVFRREFITTQWRSSVWHSGKGLLDTQVRVSDGAMGTTLFLVSQGEGNQVVVTTKTLGSSVSTKAFSFGLDAYQGIVFELGSSNSFVLDKKDNGKLQAIHRDMVSGQFKGSHFFH
jgi:hypothetical protein